MKPDYHSAEFLLSVANLSQLPPDVGVEVAFVGRSNAGKSSVLNQLTQNKNLARVSKTPGRTQHINLFTVDKKRRLVDLPGYGYAKVPPAMKEHWKKTLDAYLRSRECLKGLVLVMDIRHPFKPFDQQLLIWTNACNLPVHILLNKSDKLSANEIRRTINSASDFINNSHNPVSLQIFSALKGDGIKELRQVLDGWFA